MRLFNDELIARLPDDPGWPAGAVWIKSSFSYAMGDCVEVADLSGGALVGVRDSKHPDGPRLEFTPGEWASFVQGAKAGEFDHIGRP